MQRQRTPLSLLVALVLALVVGAPLRAVMAQTAGIPGTGAGTAGGGPVDFVGTVDIKAFTVQGDQVIAVGTVSGVVTDASGAVVHTVRNVPVPDLGVPLQTPDTCDLMHLEIGPLDLDRRGLVVHLDPVVLDIAAVPGADPLLGPLLCAIAGVLDPRAGAGIPVGIITDLLNALLDWLAFLG
jgi:hypothetical protein